MFSPKEQKEIPPSNIRLTHLAMLKVMDAMQQSVKRMDDFLTNEMCKFGTTTSHVTLVSTAATTPGTRGSLSSGLEADVESMISSRPTTPNRNRKMGRPSSASQHTTKSGTKTNNASTSYIPPTCPVDPHVLKKAANDMLDARKYILKTLKSDLHPFLLKHAIVRAVNDHTVHLIRLALESNVEILDFRALEYWLCRSQIPQHLDMAPVRTSSSMDTMSSEISLSDLSSGSSSPAWTISTEEIGSRSSSLSSRSYNFPYNFFTPPNEFDWFSGDKMGTLLSMPEACELFSIIKMADCAKQLQELYMNAKRAQYFACPVETLSAVTETLADLKCLTKLVLRGLCDDDMLRMIGQNIHQLRHLDVSGSQFVSDTGIQNLFFKRHNNQYSALYLISAWIVKNMDKMNPCSHCLQFLDYSWTSVTALGRKMVQLLPGSFLFKRLMASNAERDSYGHHIFIREQPCMHDLIPSRIGSPQCKIFEKHLTPHVGARGVKGFMTIVEHHPWRNCVLSLFTLKNTDILTNMTSAFGKFPNHNGSTKTKHCYGIITPNQSEKRIQGVVYWNNDILTQLYTIFPVNINTLGMLNHLKLYRGIVSEVWRLQYSLLPSLVHLDVFVEPATFINIIQYCPSLRRLRVRIRQSSINDIHLVKAIETSMCSRTLEDIWIAPAKFIEVDSSKDDDDDKSVKGVDSTSTKGNASNVSSFNSFVQKSSSRERVPSASSSSNPPITTQSALDLVQLSINCVDALIEACPRLRRLGDLSTWTEVEAEELYVYCERLKTKNPNILIIWGNLNLPKYSRKDKEKDKDGMPRLPEGNNNKANKHV